MRLSADLHLEIDGRAATLRGSGRRLTLELERASMLRGMLRVSLPRLGGAAGDDGPTLRQLPDLMAALDLSLEIRDRRGSLLVVGADAAGARLTLPGLGRLDNVSLANPKALLRLGFG